MSYDGTEDRDYYLRRDGIQSWDATNAGVNQYDSAETARAKVEQYQQRNSPSLTSFDTSSSSATPSTVYPGNYGSGGSSIQISGKQIAAFFLLLLLAAIGVSAWLEQDRFFAYIQEARRDKAGVKRIKAFSDFSRLEDWPARVQETYRKQEDKPLATLMDEIPENLRKLSPAKRQQLGAQIWFKISAKGAEANDYLVSVQNTPHRVGSPLLRAGSLSLYFLQHECEQGFEPACLDAAKSFAGLVWHGKQASEDAWVIDKALKQLPSSGSRSVTPAVEVLRKKILSERPSLAP